MISNIDYLDVTKLHKASLPKGKVAVNDVLEVHVVEPAGELQTAGNLFVPRVQPRRVAQHGD